MSPSSSSPMNCRDLEPLLLAERDAVLTPDQHASLERHVAACPACRQLRTRLGETLDAYQVDAASVPVPDAEAEWRTLRAQLPVGRARFAPRRLAPVIWFGSSLAVAAALAIVFFRPAPQPPTAAFAAPAIARAEFVETGDRAASTIVYVDKDSGWLVVWAANPDPKTRG